MIMQPINQKREIESQGPFNESQFHQPYLNKQKQNHPDLKELLQRPLDRNSKRNK